MTTFNDFVSSRRFTDDLSEVTDSVICEPGLVEGYVYLDSYYIIRESGEDFVVELGSESSTFGDLQSAEKFLWEEFALLETNNHLERVQFFFGDDPNFEGFADGTTWNGFDNVRVTAAVHKQVMEHFRKEYEDAGESAEHVDYYMQSFTELEPDLFGLYDYGNGFATVIDEDHYHVINR